MSAPGGKGEDRGVEGLRIEVDLDTEAIDAGIERIARIVNGGAALAETKDRLLDAILCRLDDFLDGPRLRADGTWNMRPFDLRFDKIEEWAVAHLADDDDGSGDGQDMNPIEREAT